MQTRMQSFTEVIVNTFTGMIGSFIITYLCIHSIKDTLVSAITTVVLCTIWSLVRGWFIRRAFNRMER